MTAAMTGALLLLGGCQSLRNSLQNTDSFLGVITPYRIDIVQGNVVTKEQLAQLKPGLTKPQVREVLGSPLLADIFHADRWDYIFTIRRPGAEAVRRHVVVNFENDRMTAVEAPELPSEREFVASISGSIKTPPPRKLELSDEERKALPAPRHEEAPPSDFEPQGAVRDYPPLEPAS